MFLVSLVCFFEILEFPKVLLCWLDSEVERFILCEFGPFIRSGFFLLFGIFSLGYFTCFSRISMFLEGTMEDEDDCEE